MFIMWRRNERHREFLPQMRGQGRAEAPEPVLQGLRRPPAGNRQFLPRLWRESGSGGGRRGKPARTGPAASAAATATGAATASAAADGARETSAATTGAAATGARETSGG
jgi:hypothetical protein